MITFGEFVDAIRTGEMSDELRALDITTILGILSGKPYRCVAVYNTADDKYERLQKAANAYTGDIAKAPAWLKPYLECSAEEKAKIAGKAKELSLKLERQYAGKPIHSTATKLVLCDESMERDNDFMIEDLIEAVRRDNT